MSLHLDEIWQEAIGIQLNSGNDSTEVDRVSKNYAELILAFAVLQSFTTTD